MSEDAEKCHNEQCPDPEHTEHLCFLQYEGYHFGHKPEYKALVQDAQFLCSHCGRTAQSAANLCAPVPL